MRGSLEGTSGLNTLNMVNGGRVIITPTSTLHAKGGNNELMRDARTREKFRKPEKLIGGHRSQAALDADWPLALFP
jgi:hypothetical protein